MMFNKGFLTIKKGIAFILCACMVGGCYSPLMQVRAQDVVASEDAKTTSPGRDYVEQEVVLFYGQNYGNQVESAVKDNGDQVKSILHTGAGELAVVSIDAQANGVANATVEERVSSYKNIEGVSIAQPNYIYKSNQKTTNTFPDWYSEMTQLQAGREALRGESKQKVVVSILDDGSNTQAKDTLSHALGEEYAHYISTTHGTANTTVGLMEGVAKAISSGASIIDLNVSVVGNVKDEAAETIYQTAAEKDKLLVTPAGDTGSDSNTYPADSSSVMSVISVGEDGKRTDASGYGESKTISAPGRISTSESAAMVAGAAAILKSAGGTVSMSEIKKYICNSAKDIYGNGFDGDSGYGIVNLNQAAQKLLSRLDDDSVASDSSASAADTSTEEQSKATYDAGSSTLGRATAIYTTQAVAGQVVNFRKNASGTDLTGKTVSYTEYGTGYSGYTYGAMGADAIVLGMSGSKVKFAISGVVGVVDPNNVQILTASKAKYRSYYTVSSGRLLHYISMNLTASSYYSLDNGPAPSYLKSGTKYYSYDGHYFYEFSDTGYVNMAVDYNSNNRAHSLNPSNPYYNYFQFLPLRSTSNYSASKYNTIIKANAAASSKMLGAGNYFTSYQNTYGMNALAMVAIAANESAWGTNTYAKDRNNLFSINAVDSNSALAYSFPSVQACIKDFAETYMSKRYLNPNYSRNKGAFLGNKASGANVSYASDPYWGEKAASIMWRIDRNYGNQDAFKYNLGIKDTYSTSHTNLAVKCSSSSSSGTLYSTKLQSNVAFIVLNTSSNNGYYKVQSDAVLNSTRTGTTTSGNYNVASMYGYAPTANVRIVSKRDPSVPLSVTDSLSDGVTGFVAANTGKSSTQFSWDANSAASGYQIYYRTARNGKYKLAKTISGASITNWTKTGLSAGKEYYYKIRAYKTSGSATSYSGFSSILRAYTTIAYNRSGKVKTSSNVRKYAGTSYAKVVLVPRNQKMTIYCSTKDKAGATWYRVKFKYKKKTYYGYIMGNLVSVTKTGKVKAASLKLRKKAGTSYKNVKTMKKGASVTIKKTVTGTNGKKWYYLYYKKGFKTYKGYAQTTDIGK